MSIKNANGVDITNTGNFAIVNPFRYRGYYYDTESGLYYLRSRYYDPTTGRFVNADDLISETLLPYGLSLFTYAGNNAVNAFDNDGHLFRHFWYRGECIGHYFINKNIRIYGYIYGQSEGNVANLKIGFYNTAYSGCGWIATYNALRMLGRYIAPCDIIYYYELSGTIDYGRLGINPYSVINYFFYQGYRVSVTYDINRYDTVARRNRANILLYLYTWGAHFIAFNWQGSEFVGYNVANRDTGPHKLGKSIRSFIRSKSNRCEYMLISIS